MHLTQGFATLHSVLNGVDLHIYKVEDGRDVSWQGDVEWWDIKEAIVKVNRRGCSLSIGVLFCTGSWNMCFCSLFSSLGRGKE